MSDKVEDRDGTFAWAKECPDRYDITLYFSDGTRYSLEKYIKEIICFDAEYYKKTLLDYIWSKPKELEKFLNGQALDNLVDIKIKDKRDLMEETLQRFVDRSVSKVLNTEISSNKEKQTKAPETEGHIKVKNEVVHYLNSIGIEAYPEVVFYENALSDYYKWQREERRKKSDADGIFGYGNVGFGNYKQEYGQQIRVDVGGWISDSGINFDYPVIAVEIMKSSNLRDEIIGLQKLHGLNTVYAIIIDVFGELTGQINNIPIVSLELFKEGISKRIDLIKSAIREGKTANEIFELGKKYNVGKLR
ncbi:MAG: hypothetical protein QXV37_04540 [Candidatus Jordarchaeaceae archaeon]